jgi:hypothetical protein
MDSAISGRIPLVCRPKPPGRPLADRIAELPVLAAEPDGADHHEKVARASGVLNVAALIASDVGLPDLAAQLCWRQHDIYFAEAAHLNIDIAVMSLMPVVNLARLLIREGDGNAAYELLQGLFHAARHRGTADVRAHAVDLSALIHTDADHRKICTELWVAVLTDGARALARQGRWTQAAETMAAHRGIGNRLLDGRQIKIMSLMERGLPEQATALIDSTAATEPWEHTVANILRIHCKPLGSTASQPELDHALNAALTMLAEPEPTTTVFRTRVGLTALDLTQDRPTPFAALLWNEVIQTATSDAYAARDVLEHHATRVEMTAQQHQRLTAVLAASSLGAGTLPEPLMADLSAAVEEAENRLRVLLGVATTSRGAANAASSEQRVPNAELPLGAA